MGKEGGGGEGGSRRFMVRQSLTSKWKEGTKRKGKEKQNTRHILQMCKILCVLPNAASHTQIYQSVNFILKRFLKV